VQVVELKAPVPLVDQLTVPVGVLVVPGDVSATVAVQDTVVPLVADTGQLMLVDVSLGFAVIDVLPELELWLESPP